MIIDTDFKLRQTKSLTDDDPLMNISDLHPEPLLIIPKEEPQCDVNIKEEADEEVSDSFRKKRDRKRHLKLFHCTYCDKGFRYNHELVAHTSLHTGTTPHVCETCGKGFVSQKHLLSHKSVHTDERPFVCKNCGKTYK